MVEKACSKNESQESVAMHFNFVAVFNNFNVLMFSVFTSGLKLLLLNSYRSTDFEVHRNWLAITSSLPVSKWYHEKTSEWTLDYPPFFAWFEYALSHIAFFFDHKMLVVDNLNYASKQTVLFQRLSVIIGDILLLLSLKVYAKQCLSRSKNNFENVFVVLAVLLNAGLVMVDHIHFQYNGFLFSFLIMSITKMQQDQYLQSAFWFVVLLNFKHIFLYIAPVYFVYLLRSYCFMKGKATGTDSMFNKLIGCNIFYFSIFNILKLGFVVISVFGISFGPFIYMGQLSQLLSRLFPVKRGLCHAYWAANFWAVYNSLDKTAVIIGPKFGLQLSDESIGSFTGGMVGQQNFAVLPNIPPIVTAVITLLAMMPALLKLWYRPYNKLLFLPCLTLCAYASFIFGYHVHEKAVLLIIIPLTFLSIKNILFARVYTILSITGHFALFPLLYEQAETPVKVVIFLLFTTCSMAALTKIHCSTCYLTLGIPFVRWFEALYLYGLIPVYLYSLIGHSLCGLDKKLPFLPLLMTSLYCSVGVLWSWLVLYVDYLSGSFIEDNKKKL